MRLLTFGLLFASFASAHAQDKLPTVVILGDSIRLGYTAAVQKHLAGKANVVSPKANGGDSSNVLKNLDAWVIKEKPSLVHFNCGIHDTKKSKTTGKFQVSPEAYEANLRKIVERLRSETKATVLFALTTPIHTERAAKTRSDRDYVLTGEAVEQYNAIARKVMAELKIPVNDVHAVCGDAEARAKLLIGDGVHFSGEGSLKLGTAVAEFIEAHLRKK